MAYYINLDKLSIEAYQEKLKTAYLPPSRMILKEKLEERFGYFESIGLKNVQELIQLLKKKEQWGELLKAECLSEEYLKILLRELNSILPKPNKIRDFPGISKETADKLETLGIKNTLKLYDKVLTASDREELSELTGIDSKQILELTKLTDLSRIKWVGVTFARMLYDLGIDSVEKAAKADPSELHQAVNRLSKEQGIYKAQIGLNDIRIFVDAANEVPIEIEY